MAKRSNRIGLRHRDLLTRLVPFGCFALPVAIGISAQTTDSTQTTSEKRTPGASSAFSRGPSGGTTQGGATAGSPETTPEEPVGASSNVPPSFYGASSPTATSSLGLPGFAASAREVQSPVAPNYPLQWGPFSFHPHLAYDYTYATGVLFTPGHTTNTALHTLLPGLSITSKHLTIDYTPSLNYYSSGPYGDYTGHRASLLANFGYSDWAFHLDQNYNSSSNPLVETGVQTHVESFGTAFDALWNLSERWFFDFTLSQYFQDSQNFQSSRQWSTMEWANYRLTQELSFGVGVGAGFTDVDLGADSTFEQIQGRINWHPSGKLSIDLNGGVEIRQFDASGTDNLINPIMGASIYYQVFEHTSLYLSASRTVDTSLFINQITENASISGGINQRLLKYLNLTASAGYRRTDYKGTFVIFNQLFPTLRKDDYAYASATLGTSFLKKGTVSVGYTHGENQSNLPGYTYNSDQLAVRVAYRF